MPSGRASTSAANLRTEACSPPRRRPDASRCNPRPGLTATNDREASAERGERFCRGQPNAIGGTRDQDLLVVHGTAIQGSVHVRMIGSMIRDLTNQRSMERHNRGSKSVL